MREIFARFDALEIGTGEVVLVHGDLASQNVAFAPETSEVLGIYDFEDMACVDRHWDFKYVHSYPALTNRGAMMRLRLLRKIGPVFRLLMRISKSLRYSSSMRGIRARGHLPSFDSGSALAGKVVQDAQRPANSELVATFDLNPTGVV